MLVDHRITQYVVAPNGMVLFASNRRALLSACPELETFIRREVPAREADRPLQLVVADKEPRPLIAFEPVMPSVPAWWVALRAAYDHHMKGTT